MNIHRGFKKAADAFVKVVSVCPYLAGIIEAGVTQKDGFALVLSAPQTFDMNQAQTGRAEILVRAGVPLTFNGFAAPAVGIAECVLSTEVPKPKYAVHRGIVVHVGAWRL
jgi:hypothetical protein